MKILGGYLKDAVYHKVLCNNSDFLNVYTEPYHLLRMFTFIHLFESHNNPIKKCFLHFISKESKHVESKHVSPC